MGRDNSAASAGRYCGSYWRVGEMGRVCTRPAKHDGPCVDRIHNSTRPGRVNPRRSTQ